LPVCQPGTAASKSAASGFAKDRLSLVPTWTEGGAVMVSPRVKLALVTLAALAAAVVVGGNGWSV